MNIPTTPNTATASTVIRTPKIAIIGDNFMHPHFFMHALKQQGFQEEAIRTRTLPWPDEPVEHGYAKDKIIYKNYPSMERLREYQGAPQSVVTFIDDAEIFVTHLAPLPKEAITMLAERGTLKMVAVSRGGAVNVDLVALKQHHIPVINTPGRNASAVAEFTIGAILAETRLIRLGHESLRSGLWRGDLYRADRTGEELSQLTVGIVGYGHIGRDVARILKAFHAKLLITDPYVSALSDEDKAYGVTLCSLERLLAESDVINMSTRVTPETTKMIGEREFKLMRPGSYFINVARGPLVDYEALYDALASEHLRGAMLDTFFLEPIPPTHPLLKLSNVTLTPHIAGASKKTVTIAATSIAEDIARYVKGEPCKHYAS